MCSLFSKDIAVLDVTSRLISAIVGVKKAQSVFGIKSVVSKQHQGYENGEWFDVQDTASVAKEVIKEAMKSAGSRSKRLFIGVPAEFASVYTDDRIYVDFDRKRRIIDDDIDYIYKKGEDFDKGNFVTINRSPVYFILDNNSTPYLNVLGMEARSVTACVSYMLADRKFINLFEGIATELGFTDVRFISTEWAEGIHLLEEEQREGVYVLVDVGYLSSSVCVSKGEGILDMKSFSMGGGHIAADICEFLNVPFEMAEDAKRLIDLNLTYSDDAILVGDDDNVVYAVDACEIAKNRLNMFADVLADIFRDFEGRPLPIYLTGEGIASMRGAKNYLSEQLERNIEIITPRIPNFVKPEDSSRASLLIMADVLSREANFGRFIKRLFNGGKNK